jgi:hypothetical protein
MNEYEYQFSNLRTLRAAFWESHPQYTRVSGYSQNDYPTDIRVAWCDYVNSFRDSGRMSASLAQRSTL